MELKSWISNFVKAKDAFDKRLKNCELNENILTCVYTNKVHHFLISPKLIIPEAKDFFSVVCLNNVDNITFLAENWSYFLRKNLTIIFVNDDGSYWQINPLVHSKVADPDTLLSGLMSLSGIYQA